jgi:hypothetical protein
VRLGWLLHRAHRRGFILSQCLQDFAWSPPRIFKRVAHGLVRVAYGAALLPGSLVRGPVPAIRGLREIAFGLGLLHGLIVRRR